MIDPLVTESSNFWQNHGEMNDVRPADIQTGSSSASRPPASPKRTVRSLIRAAGCSGTGRRPNRRAKRPRWQNSRSPVYAPARSVSARGRRKPGAGAEYVLGLSRSLDPQPEEVAREANGKALRDIVDEQGPGGYQKGQQLSSFAQLKMTVQPAATAGFTAAAGPSRAIRWRTAIIATRMV